MYSKKLEQTLKKAGVSQGDEISISVNGVDYSGILMPRPVGDEKNAELVITSASVPKVQKSGF